MAMTHPYVPPFFVRFNEIQHNPEFTPEADGNGSWKPSLAHGANCNLGGMVQDSHWYCDGETIRTIHQVPTEAEKYSTISAYYVGGVGIWVLKGDARIRSETETGWHLLCFSYEDRTGSSFLTNAGQHETIRFQPQNAAWPRLLLPDIYHTHNYAENPIFGGITGELPIFLALLAFSTPREYLPRIPPFLFNQGVWAQQHQWQRPRIHKRGLVVTVYSCPPVSSSAILDQYEKGCWGKYFS